MNNKQIPFETNWTSFISDYFIHPPMKIVLKETKQHTKTGLEAIYTVTALWFLQFS